MTNYYSILGLQPGASKSEIKKAYRRLAMLYHPDKNKSHSAKQLFIRIDQAYNALMNGNTAIPFAQKTSQPKKRTRTPFEKWANVQDAPTNPQDYAEWYKVKREQMRSKSKEKAQNRYYEGNYYNRKEEAYAPLGILVFVGLVIFFLVTSGENGNSDSNSIGYIFLLVGGVLIKLISAIVTQDRRRTE